MSRRLRFWLRVGAAPFVGAAFALLPLGALAQEGGAFEGAGGGVGGYDAWDWFGLGLRLGLVLLVIWAAVMAMRWYVRRTAGTGVGGGGRQLQVLETRALGPNRSLHLVRLGQRAVLLGVTPERITQVLEIDDPQEVERISTAIASADAAPRSLRSIVGTLGDSISRMRGPREQDPSIAAPVSQRLRATEGYREAQIAEIQRAIARARQEAAQ